MSEQLSLLDPPKAPRASFYVRGQALTVPEFEAADRVAGRQDLEILAVFQARPGQKLSPWIVLDILNQETLGGAPIITSVRRSISTLTKRKKLIHHPKERANGPYGSPSSLWSLA